MKRHASSFGALAVVGVAAIFCAALSPHAAEPNAPRGSMRIGNGTSLTDNTSMGPRVAPLTSDQRVAPLAANSADGQW